MAATARPAACPLRARAEVTSPPDSHQAVNVSQPSSTNVFSRCTAMNIARAMVALSATSWNSTRPAPTAASVSMKKTVQPAARRAGCPGGHARLTHTEQRDDGYQRETAGDAVRKLDQRRDARIPRQHDPVAERPVLAAAGARPAGADVRAPEDHRDVVSQHAPRKPGEAAQGGNHSLYFIQFRRFGTQSLGVPVSANRHLLAAQRRLLHRGDNRIDALFGDLHQ